jgi:hypothetical protein
MGNVKRDYEGEMVPILVRRPRDFPERFRITLA